MSTDSAEAHDGRMVALQAEVADLRRSVRQLERQQPARGQSSTAAKDVLVLASELGMEQALDCVRRLTEAMFPGDVAVEVTVDPEWPEEYFVVFNVTATGDVEQMLDRQREWHEEVLRRAPDVLNLFRISVTPA